MLQASNSHIPLAINAHDLSFRYVRSQASVINIPDWQVPVGEKLFLQGASGSGKSTLLQLLCGLRLGNGTLSIAGSEMSQLSQAKRDRFRAKHIGMVFQQFNLVPYLSSLDNVLLAATLAGRANRDTRALAESLLNDVGIHTKIWKQPASTLSIGQQQRVAIARALINSPPILLFDEPTSALDEANRHRFMQFLGQYLETHKDTTAIFVSHDAALTSYFDRSVTLSDLSSSALNGAIDHAI